MSNFRKLLASALATVLLAGAASAHFVWIHVLEGGRVEVLFGDGVYQDTDANLVRYVDGLEAWLPSGDPVAFREHAWGLSGELAPGERVVVAYRDMGLFSRPGSEVAVKLDYYAKGARTLADAGPTIGTKAELVARAEGEHWVLLALFDGRPAVGAELTLPVGFGTDTFETDAYGEVRIPRPPTGVFSAKAKVVLAEGGELDGEAYAAEHHYATLVVADARADAGESARGDPDASGDRGDPDARLRLEDAYRRVHRLPLDLIGLAGALTVNVDGRTWRGEFECVDGRLAEFVLEDAPESWRSLVREQVVDMVTSRVDSGFDRAEGAHPVRLADRDGHPLGRSVLVEDAARTEHRIVESRIQSTARQLADGWTFTRFLAYEEAGDGRVLPTHFARQRFDGDGVLLVSETTSDTFRSADGARLPSRRTIVRAAGGEVHAIDIELRNLELYDTSDRSPESQAPVQ